MLIADIYIPAVQQAFICHRHISKDADPLFTGIILCQKFALKCFIPGVGLDHPYLKPVARISK